ncbi:zinc finger protein 593-like [Centruroides sculpturatus]|uniref:zinc finger protein 593-like n=1 Tax=Centruroides sculpturatus TaxID=218467 RepID=UPI000C6CB9AF|nr:zinc finger protein 593-like [Centruroides sculpturatus]
MGRYARKKNNRGYTALHKKCKTKRRKKDLDEIHSDMKNAAKMLKQEIDHDQVGNAQFYCLHCARYFIDNETLTKHFRSKVHKRRLKALEVEPYSQEEAEAAAGMGNYVQLKTRKVETQPNVKSEAMCTT